MTVKAWLTGHQFDLETIADLFSSGATRVAKEGDAYYLSSAEIDNRDEGVQFYEIAPVLLKRLNGLASAMRPNDFRVVTLTNRYTVDEHPHTVVRADAAEARALVRRPTVVVRLNPADERNVAQPINVVVGSGKAQSRFRATATGTVTRNGVAVEAEKEPAGARYVAITGPDTDEALVLLTNPTWVNLYKVYEIINATGMLTATLAKAGLNEADIRLFKWTANHPQASGAEARHGRSSQQPPPVPMTLTQARSTIGKLVIAWLDVLGQSSRV